MLFMDLLVPADVLCGQRHFCTLLVDTAELLHALQKTCLLRPCGFQTCCVVIVIFCTLLMDTSELLHSRKHAYAVFIPVTGVWLQIFCTLLMDRSELLRSKKQLACCGYASFQTRYNDVLCGYIDTFTIC